MFVDAGAPPLGEQRVGRLEVELKQSGLSSFFEVPGSTAANEVAALPGLLGFQDALHREDQVVGGEGLAVVELHA